MTLSSLVVSSVSIEVASGVLSAQVDVDALVVMTDAQLMPISVAGRDVHARAGEQLAANCRAAAALLTVDDVVAVTGAYELCNKAILHCREPVDKRHPLFVEDLAVRYRRILRIAEAQGLRSIALEPMRDISGVADAGREVGVMVDCIRNHAEPLQHLRLLRYILPE